MMAPQTEKTFLHFTILGTFANTHFLHGGGGQIKGPSQIITACMANNREGNQTPCGCSLSRQRLHVFLFSELLVLTRPVTRNERSCFQVYRQPIPVRDLALEDLQDGEVRLGGSFRGAFANADKGALCNTF